MARAALLAGLGLCHIWVAALESLRAAVHQARSVCDVMFLHGCSGTVTSGELCSRRCTCDCCLLQQCLEVQWGQQPCRMSCGPCPLVCQ